MPAPVKSSTVNQIALKAALEAAGGDQSRLQFEADGSVTVLNKPRSAR